MNRRDSHLSGRSALSGHSGSSHGGGGGSSSRRERGRQPASPNPNPSLTRSSSRARPRSRSRAPRSKSPTSPNRDRERARSKSRDSRAPAKSSSSGARSGTPSRSGRKPSSGNKSSNKREFGTPFDGKGKCHYHSNVQLAKKKLTGGWKLLLDNCPICIEEDKDDNKSVCSRRSTRSSRSVRSSSGRSRSGGGGGSSGGNGGGPRNKLISIKKDKSRYECPFDSQGYCHRHGHVRLAKKKITGGWKILQSQCGECLEDDCKDDDNKSVSSRRSHRSVSSRRSTASRSRRSPSRYDDDESESDASTIKSEINQKRLVNKMKYTDDNGEEGLYTGYVNSQYKPHGSGKMVYSNGITFSGEWCEGSKVHGKVSKEKSSRRRGGGERKDKHKQSIKSNGGSQNGSNNATSPGAPAPVKEASPDKQRHGSKKENKEPVAAKPMTKERQNALKEYKELFNTAQVAKNMLFVDFYGDRGRYTGEVNGRNIPHGMGEITYDHGLVQEGMWTNGVMDEGSVISGPNMRPSGASVSSSRRMRSKSKDP